MSDPRRIERSSRTCSTTPGGYGRPPIQVRVSVGRRRRADRRARPRRRLRATSCRTPAIGSRWRGPNAAAAPVSASPSAAARRACSVPRSTSTTTTARSRCCACRVPCGPPAPVQTALELALRRSLPVALVVAVSAAGCGASDGVRDEGSRASRARSPTPPCRPSRSASTCSLRRARAGHAPDHGRRQLRAGGARGDDERPNADEFGRDYVTALPADARVVNVASDPDTGNVRVDLAGSFDGDGQIAADPGGVSRASPPGAARADRLHARGLPDDPRRLRLLQRRRSPACRTSPAGRSTPSR